MSALVVAVLLGAIMANTGLVPARCQPGLAWAARKLLRLGVVLLGLRLTLTQIRSLGPKGLGLVVVVVVVVTLTFFATQWLGRRLGLSAPMSLLVATGFSICGASAVAAMRGVTPEADDEDLAYAIALVTLCGTLAIFVLPAASHVLGVPTRDVGIMDRGPGFACSASDRPAPGPDSVGSVGRGRSFAGPGPVAACVTQSRREIGRNHAATE